VRTQVVLQVQVQAISIRGVLHISNNLIILSIMMEHHVLLFCELFDQTTNFHFLTEKGFSGVLSYGLCTDMMKFRLHQLKGSFNLFFHRL
jgi:hypothetical protein